MWLYLQELQRHDDPQMAVRRKAEFKAAARRNRLAALKWFGFSNQRPQASASPFTNFYSPVWRGNGSHQYLWIGSGYPAYYYHR
jgi:hypothetical protein